MSRTDQPSASLSKRLTEKGYPKRDDRLECDECGKLFTAQFLPIHQCEGTADPTDAAQCECDAYCVKQSDAPETENCYLDRAADQQDATP